MDLQETLARCAKTARSRFAGAPPRREADAILYFAHVECAAPLRRIAEASGTPLTSVHRAIRRIEQLRDDPLLDAALDAIAAAIRHADAPALSNEDIALPHPATGAAAAARKTQAQSHPNRLAQRALARLAEPESFLIVAKGAEKAGVFCRKNKFRRPLALVTLEMAADFAARDWVRMASRTEMSAKYVIAEPGRAFLRRLAAEEQARNAPVEASSFAAQHGLRGVRQVARADGAVESIRVNVGESPLGWLARRKGADGQPFLEPEEVEAGERLRDDFEAAQMGPRVAQDWRKFLTPRDGASGPGAGPCEGPSAARDRFAKALAELGPGLSDAALRACCFLEGLEATERRMGWSARSGKVVLKLALQRLAYHYGVAPQRSGPVN